MPTRYQHIYHAGNLGDIVKHLLLCEWYVAMGNDGSAVRIIDLYAGHGTYDLASAKAQERRAYAEGFGRIWAARSDWSEHVFFDLVRLLNDTNQTTTDGVPRFYPGSPYIAQGLSDDRDTLVLCDASAAACRDLQLHFGTDNRVRVIVSDGPAALASVLRGSRVNNWSIFIDPPYVDRKHWEQTVHMIRILADADIAHRAMVWYPLSEAPPESMLEVDACLSRYPIVDVRVRMSVPEGAPDIQGCGLRVINPPRDFLRRCHVVLEQLKKCFQGELSTLVKTSFPATAVNSGWVKENDPLGERVERGR